MKITEILCEAPQPRVTQGMATQNVVAAYLQSKLGDDFEFVSQAPASSTAPDLVANIHGTKTQFEIKGREHPTASVKIYEKRVKRGMNDPVINSFIAAYTNGKVKTLDQYIDVMRSKVDDSIGYPDDEGVFAPAGKFYIGTDDAKVRTNVRRHLMNHLLSSNDDYFAIHTRSNNDVAIFDVGSANNELPAPKVPNIRRVTLETYGSAGTEGVMRLAIKVLFTK